MLPLTFYFFLNIYSGFFILVSAAIPLLLSSRLKGKIRLLTIILAIFVFVHGMYHVSVILGYVFLGSGILDPLSVVILVFFGLYYLRLLRANERLRRVSQ